jgi:hypothetical protein
VMDSSEICCWEADAFNAGATASRRFWSVVTGIERAKEGLSPNGFGTGKRGAVSNPADAACSESRGNGKFGGAGATTGNVESSIQSPMRRTETPSSLLKNSFISDP